MSGYNWIVSVFLAVSLGVVTSSGPETEFDPSSLSGDPIQPESTGTDDTGSDDTGSDDTGSDDTG